MKCLNCNMEIVIHDNLLPKKTARKLNMLDITTRGMIYTVDGLREYSNNNFCQICNDELQLGKGELKSYRLRLIK